MRSRIVAILATFALAFGLGVTGPAEAADPRGKLVGYSDAADGAIVPIYEYTPPKLTNAEKAKFGKVTKGVKRFKAAPPAPHAQASKRVSGPPWYHWAGGRQNVTADGIFANCNVPASTDPYLRPTGVPSAGVQGDVHSLCQLAVIENDFVSNRDIGEIGWVKSIDPAICPTGSRCLFGSHWVNGVHGGWNSSFTDNAANPVNLGKVLSATCAGGNTRFGVQYFNADWWLWFDECSTDATPGDWLGFYAGSLWSGSGGYTVAGTVSGFGEVASNNDSNPCSDMGNGDTPTATGTASRVGTVQLINAAAATNLTMWSNSNGHGSVPQAYTAVASNTPTTTYRFGGPGYTATNALPGVNGGC
jgi:hypothetical protein